MTAMIKPLPILLLILLLASLGFSLSVTYPNSTTAILTTGLGTVNLTLQNPIKSNGTDLFLQDCDLTTCKLQIQAIPSYNVNVANTSNLIGKVSNSKFGGTAFSGISSYQTRTVNQTLPIVSTCYDVVNGTNMSYACQNGTTTIQINETKWYPLTSINWTAGQSYLLGFDYQKSNPNDVADLVPSIMGGNITGWAWWNSSWLYQVNCTIGNLSGAGVPQPSSDYFPAICQMNTSNSTLFNTTNCGNVRVLANNTGNPLPYDLHNFNSSFCGNATNNATFIVAAPNISNGTNLTFYLGNTAATNGVNSTGVCQLTNATSILHMNNSATDACGNNSMATQGTVSYIIDASYCKFGSCANLTTSTSYFNLTSGAKYTSGTTGSSMSIWGRKSSSATTSNGLMFVGAASGAHMRAMYVNSTPSMVADIFGANVGLALAQPSLGMDYYATDWGNTSNAVILWQNSTSTSGSLTTLNTTASGFFYVGWGTSGTNGWAGSGWGTLDEARLYADNKSSDWHLDEFGQNWSVGSVGTIIPVVNSVSVKPAAAYIADPIFCQVNATSNFSSTFNITYNWFKNGVNQTALAGTNTTYSNNTFGNVSRVLAGNLTVGDNWSCSAFATDAGSSSVVTSVNDTINNNGFFLCDANFTVHTINYSFFDQQDGSSINASFLGLYSFSPTINGVALSVVNGTNNTLNVCVLPANLSATATASEQASASGYVTVTNTWPSQTYSNVSIARKIYLLSTVNGTFYVFTIENQYQAAIQNATVSIYRFQSSTNSWELVNTQQSDSLGAASFFMQPLTPYQVTVNASGFNFVNVSFVPSAQTNIVIVVSTNVTINLTSINTIWKDTNYSFSPPLNFYNTSKNITFNVSSNTSNLTSIGMVITKNANGTNTVVYNTTSTNPAGDFLTYQADPSGLYQVNAWIQHNQTANFSLIPRSIYITNTSTGLDFVGNLLAAGGTGVPSTWTYYFIALLCSAAVGVFVSRFAFAAAPYAALLCLWIFTFVGWGLPPLIVGGGFPVYIAWASIGITAVTLGAVYTTSWSG